MSSKLTRTLLVVGMLLIAGCAGGVPGTGTDGGSAGTGTTAADAGTVNFYISDEENAIDDFRHLNVTVTKVGFETASSDGWQEYDVDNRTVDLTELKGENATLMESYTLSQGNYTKVFVHVGEVNATLRNGERVTVKLPSEKLQITEPFTVENGSETNFVFDIAVHKAGNSGKYILKPVISQSGTDVPIREVDDDDDEELLVEFADEPVRGEDATLTVTRNGSAVANATVELNDEVVGTTDADGQLTVTIPDAEEVEFEVGHDDAEGELELEFGEDESDEADDESDEADDESDEADDEAEGDEVEDDGDESAEEDEETTESEEDTADDEEEAADLNASFVGNVTQGENATVRVTRNDSTVENATVAVNGERVGATDANGELTFEVPDAETLEVEIAADGEGAELEVEFDEES